MPLRKDWFKPVSHPIKETTVTVNEPLPQQIGILINEKDLPHCYHWVRCNLFFFKSSCPAVKDRMYPQGEEDDFMSGYNLIGPIYSGHMKDRKIAFHTENVRFKQVGFYEVHFRSFVGMRGSNKVIAWSSDDTRVVVHVKPKEEVKSEEGKEEEGD
jgi:hypothetical protein